MELVLWLSISNRKEQTGLLQSWLPPARFFLVSRCLTTRVGFGKRVRSPTRRPSRRRRDQKTFSAGPRSFTSGELWFSASIAAARGQPFADSRHGRIVCKVSLSCTCYSGEPPPPITSEGSSSNPFTGWWWLSQTLSMLFQGSSAHYHSQMAGVHMPSDNG